MSLLDRVKTEWGSVASAPSWRRNVLAMALLIAAGYFLWCQYGTKPPAPAQVLNAAPPSAVANEPTKTVQSPVVVYKDPVRVTGKLKVDPPGRHEEAQTAAEIPRLRDGGKAVVFLNTSTGVSRVQIRANDRPWISFERGNTAGIKAEVSSKDGQVYSAYYRRDFLQIKGAYLVGAVEANTRPEARAGMALEYRW